MTPAGDSSRRRGWFRVLLLLCLGLAALVGAALWLHAAPEPRRADVRLAELLLTSADPGREDVHARKAASDAVLRRLADAGVEDPATEIARQLRDVDVSDAEVRTFLAQNSAMFGGRGYPEDAETARRLLRLHAVRRSLGVADPPTGLRWPD